MTKRTKRVEFHKLITLADVQKERHRVGRALARRQEWLEEDYERITEVLSVDYWRAILSDKISGIAAGWLGSGFGLAGSLLNRAAHSSGKGHRRRRREEEEEELILIVEQGE
jgi:hypothetical protein